MEIGDALIIFIDIILNLFTILFFIVCFANLRFSFELILTVNIKNELNMKFTLEFRVLLLYS